VVSSTATPLVTAATSSSAPPPAPATGASSTLEAAAPSTTALGGAMPVGTTHIDSPRNAPPAPATEEWAHLRTILARLSPREAAITETVIARMPPEARMSWLAELSALGADQAAEAIRSMIPKATQAKPQTATRAIAADASTQPTAALTTKPQTAPADATTAVKLPQLSPEAMAHFVAIQAALTTEEAAFVRAAASALSPTDLHALIDEFSAMSVSVAVERVRALLAEAQKPGAA